MLRKISLLVVAAVFALGLMAFAGCGDDEESSGGGGGGSTTEESTPAAEETPTSTGNDEADAAVKQAVDGCKQSVQAQSATLSQSAIADLEKLCTKAASGDVEDVQKAAVEVCKKIVNESVPASAPASAKEQALAACDQAGGG